MIVCLVVEHCWSFFFLQTPHRASHLIHIRTLLSFFLYISFLTINSHFYAHKMLYSCFNQQPYSAFYDSNCEDQKYEGWVAIYEFLRRVNQPHISPFAYSSVKMLSVDTASILDTLHYCCHLQHYIYTIFINSTRFLKMVYSTTHSTKSSYTPFRHAAVWLALLTIGTMEKW